MGGARTLTPLVLPQPGSLDSYRRQSVAHNTHAPLQSPSFSFYIHHLSAHRLTAVRSFVSYLLFFLSFSFLLSFWIMVTTGIYCKTWPRIVTIFSPKPTWYYELSDAFGKIEPRRYLLVRLFSHRAFVRDQAIDEPVFRFPFSSVGPHVFSQSFQFCPFSPFKILKIPPIFPLTPLTLFTM